MKIDVKKVANLANLSLSPDEEKKFSSQLNSILTYVEKINEIDAAGVNPTSQVTGLENVTRNDELSDSLSQEKALSATNSQHNGMFKVKQLINID